MMGDRGWSKLIAVQRYQNDEGDDDNDDGGDLIDATGALVGIASKSRELLKPCLRDRRIAQR